MRKIDEEQESYETHVATNVSCCECHLVLSSYQEKGPTSRDGIGPILHVCAGTTWGISKYIWVVQPKKETYLTDREISYHSVG